MQLITFKIALYWLVINSPIQQRMEQTGFLSLYSEIVRYYIHLKHFTVKKILLIDFSEAWTNVREGWNRIL